MSDDDFRRDYGPAGCAEGCANRGASMLLVALLVALVCKGRKR